MTRGFVRSSLDKYNSITNNVKITVTVIEGKGKKASKLSVTQGDLEKTLKGKNVQFCMF